MSSRFAATGSLTKYPARSALIYFTIAIFLGAVILWLPISRTSTAAPITFSDALFTSTSATCVTGLTVRSTGNDFNWLGQLVIMLLIQGGGLGIMTFGTFLMVNFGRSENLRHRMLTAQTLTGDHTLSLSHVLREVFLYVLFCEGIGFAILAVHLLIGSALRGNLEAMWLANLWEAAFHTVSAFCNAGFGLYDDNLVRYRTDWVVCLVIIALVILGGIGFPVVIDMRLRKPLGAQSRWHRWQLHTKFMLIGTIGLLLCGTIAFCAFEWNNILAKYAWYDRILIGLLHSTSARTAGFNTIDLGGLTNATLFMIIVLMLIGGGPCSTAGGFKVSTFVVLLLHAWSRFTGHLKVNVFRRTVSTETIESAVNLLGLFATVGAIGATAMLVCEQENIPYKVAGVQFVDYLFEVVSALCTVGLSTGVTASIGEAGRIVLILLMFIGRIGPLSIFVAFARSERDHVLEFPEEGVLVG